MVFMILQLCMLRWSIRLACKVYHTKMSPKVVIRLLQSDKPPSEKCVCQCPRSLRIFCPEACYALYISNFIVDSHLPPTGLAGRFMAEGWLLSSSRSVFLHCISEDICMFLTNVLNESFRIWSGNAQLRRLGTRNILVKIATDWSIISLSERSYRLSVADVQHVLNEFRILEITFIFPVCMLLNNSTTVCVGLAWPAAKWCLHYLDCVSSG